MAKMSTLGVSKKLTVDHLELFVNGVFVNVFDILHRSLVKSSDVSSENVAVFLQETPRLYVYVCAPVRRSQSQSVPRDTSYHWSPHLPFLNHSGFLVLSLTWNL